MSSFLGGGGGGSGSTSLTVGVTPVLSGISGYTLFDNAGILGQEIAGNPPLATSNMDWYVATTGSDSNPGTIGSPFATIQFALTIAQQIDWAGKFYPNIHVADGTYNISNQIKFPALRNPAWSPSGDLTGNLIGNSANPSNVLLVDTSAFQIGIFTATGAAYWNATGFLVDTSESAFLANTGSYIECTRMRYQDSSANNGQFCQPFNANPDGIVHAFGTQTYFPPKIFSLGAVAYFGTVEFFSTSFFCLQAALPDSLPSCRASTAFITSEDRQVSPTAIWSPARSSTLSAPQYRVPTPARSSLAFRPTMSSPGCHSLPAIWSIASMPR